MATQYDPTIFGYQNFFSALLTADITSGSLTIAVDTVPSATSGILVVDPDSATNREVIFYTSKGASNVVCPSDGRGWAGTSATAHLTGTTVIMADVASYFTGLANGTLSTDPLRLLLFPDFVQSGGIIALSAGLVGTFSNIVFYLNGVQYAGTSIANKTYTASKDTYVDITGASNGAVTVLYTEVANGAAAPALTTNYIRLGYVVTSGSAITTINQRANMATGWSGFDSIANPCYPQLKNANVVGRYTQITASSTGVSGSAVPWNGMSSMAFRGIAGKTYRVTMHEPILDGYASAPGFIQLFIYNDPTTSATTQVGMFRTVASLNGVGADATCEFTALQSGLQYINMKFQSNTITGTVSIGRTAQYPCNYTVELVS